MKKFHILLVEDNSVDADLTKRNLQNTDYKFSIEHATCIEDAREQIKGNNFDAVLLDLKLPDGSGFDLLSEITQSYGNVPVIMLTGSGSEEMAISALKSGAANYLLKKNYNSSLLCETIVTTIQDFKHKKNTVTAPINAMYIEHHKTDIDLTRRHLKEYAPYIHLETNLSATDVIEKFASDKREAEKYHVILTDLRMPDMSAFDFIKVIRNELTLNIPIILITGQGNEEIAVQALKVGADDYLSKNNNYLFRLPHTIISAHQRHMLQNQQQKLIKNEARYRLLAENIADVIFNLDLDLNYQYISPSIQKMRGYDPKELIGRNIKEFVTPESYKKLKSTFLKFVQKTKNGYQYSKVEKTLELQILTKSRQTIWIEVHASAMIDDRKQIIGILGIARDITKRKQITDELRKIYEAIKQSPVSIEITDTQGRFEYVNDAFTQLTGYSFKDLEGRNTSIHKSGMMPPELYRDLWKTIKDGRIWTGEMNNRKKDGSTYWCRLTISPLKDDNGKIINYFGAKEDVTERKKLIDDLIEARNKAQESDRLKSAFLANMSHEIRTPMNGILGFTRLLGDENIPDDQRKSFIQLINKSGDRLMETIEEILEISKIEVGNVPVEKTDVIPSQTLHYLFSFFQPQCDEKGIELELQIEKECSDLQIYTDQNKLESILTNLLKNAIKFTLEGKITLGAFVINKRLHLYVKDTGVGIPADQLNHVFERFVQADNTFNRGYEGSGLGLAIAKGHAALINAQIEATSKENEGSTFVLHLPIVKPSEYKTDKTPEDDTHLKTSRIKILVAEDDDISLEYLLVLLEEGSFDIVIAKTGVEVLEQLNAHPDTALVILDIRMPGMSGIEAIKKIREFNSKIPVIAQSAFAMPEEVESAMQAGCNDYLTKPLKKDELYKTMNKYLEN